MSIQVLAMTSINTGTDAESALQTYLSVVGPLMESVGANVVNRIELLNSIVGNNEVQYVTLVDYPDDASIKRVFDSEEYKSLDDVKKRAFSTYQVSTTVSAG